MKFSSEVRQKVDVKEGFLLLPVDFTQFLCRMKGDFDSCCFLRERRIPCAAVRAVKTAPCRPCMNERCIHNVEVGKTKYEFSYRYAWQKPSLPYQPVIRGPFKFEEIVQFIGITGKPGKDALVSVCVARGDKSMGVVLKKARDARQHLAAASPGIKQLSHAQDRRQAASHHVPEWSIAAEHRIFIWQLNPAIRKFLGIVDIQGFEHAGQHRDPGQSVLVQYLVACSLQFVKGTV